MPIVLAIEPDLRQAAIIKRIVRDKIHADVVVVDSRDAALDAIRTSIPDVLLLSALLSPRDEDELIAHLRLLDGSDHLQTHTIPQLASTSADGDSGRGRGLLGMFSRKKDTEPAAASGCDPDLFAEEIRTYLQHAHEKKEERKQLREQGIEIPARAPIAQPGKAAAAPVDETPEAEESGSSWADPFAWRPASKPGAKAKSPESRSSAAAQSAEAEVPSPESVVASHESVIRDPEPDLANHEPLIPDPEPIVASADPIVHSSEPAVEHYESVIRQPEPAVEPPPPIIRPEPIVAPAAPADPWAVDYARLHPVIEENASSMVGYTAPFSSTPAEPPKVTESLGPAFEPTLEEPVITGYDETARVAQELDLRLDEDEEDAATPLVAELSLDAADTVHEIPAHDLVIDEGEPVEEEPVAAAPAPKRRGRAKSQSLLRLMPLAMWARAEIEKGSRHVVAIDEAERTVNDELRDLMSRLAVPANVVGVSYARGCRIRRVRVPAGAEGQQQDVPGPVILSKRALEERRSRTNA
jgi:CheY-like chemotaxis protein